ncbi:hypothetical protein N9F67_00920 [bacterium]|nr:hypothetical protein [bacterium]
MASISGQSTSNISGVDGFFTTQGGGGTVTTTPTISFDSTQYNPGTIIITNSASYSDLSVFCQITSAGTLIVPNSSMSFDESTGTISYIDTGTAGSRNIELQAQDFGFASSSQVTGNYTKANANFRYWRLIYNAESSNSHTYLRELRYYDDFNQTGTSYPPNMTSNTLPSPYVASGNYIYSTTYDYWKAFDNSPNSSGWWTIGSNTTGKYIDIDFGSARDIKSVYMRFNSSYYVVTNLSVLGSDSSNFSTFVPLINSASVSNREDATLEIVIQ